MKKNHKIFITIILSILLIGCKNQDNQLENSVAITTSISEYSLTMSSVPGLPLDIKVSSDEKYTKVNIRVEVEKGDLVSWKGGKVSHLGNDVILGFADTTIYWSPLTNDSIIENDEVELEISIINDAKEMLDSKTYIITGKDGIYNLSNIVLTEEN